MKYIGPADELNTRPYSRGYAYWYVILLITLPYKAEILVQCHVQDKIKKKKKIEKVHLKIWNKAVVPVHDENVLQEWQ